MVDPRSLSRTWVVDAQESTHIRVRSQRITAMNVEVTAPVLSGTCSIDDAAVRLHLTIALEHLRMRPMFMQATARSFIQRHGATALVFSGVGLPAEPWQVSGLACAGDASVPVTLSLSPEPASSPAHLGLLGSAELGTVNLPLPGLGSVEDFTVELDAHLRIHAT